METKVLVDPDDYALSPGLQGSPPECAYQYQEYRLPLIAIKLDVASAFDHLSHSAIAQFLSHCGQRLESHVLLRHDIDFRRPSRVIKTQVGVLPSV